jgi:hypothetical protein
MSSLLVDRFEKVNWVRFLDRNGNTTVGWERPSLSLGSSSQYQKSKKNRCLSFHLIEEKKYALFTTREPDNSARI